MEKIIVSNDKEKRVMQFSEYLREKNKFIVSNTKCIANKAYTALESKYSYRSSQMHSGLHLMNEMNFRLLKSTAHQKRVS